jgi:hypothetical protein
LGRGVFSVAGQPRVSGFVLANPDIQRQKEPSRPCLHPLQRSNPANKLSK